MRKIVFELNALDDFTEWAVTDKKVFKKIVSLVKINR